MHETQKIPVIFLLKKSREECGALKSQVQELEYIIKEKDKEIEKLQKRSKRLESFIKLSSPSYHVNKVLSDFISNKNKLPNDTIKRNKRIVTMYKRMARTYNKWYEGCKILLTLMNELKNIK